MLPAICFFGSLFETEERDHDNKKTKVREENIARKWNQLLWL